MPLTIGGAVLGIAGEGLNLWNSYDAKDKAQKQLNDLNNQPIPQYTASPYLQQYYSTATNDAANPRGFTGGQRTNFSQNLADNTNTIFKNAVNTSGGNLSKYIMSALNNQNTKAYNNFAAQDASLAMQNRNSALGRQGMAVNQLQNIQDRNTQAKLMRQQLIAQALGGSISQQNSNIAGAYNNIGSLGFTAAGYGLAGLQPNAGAINNIKKNPITPNVSYNNPNYTDPDYQSLMFG